MRCEEFEVLISAYVDGELHDNERRSVEEHLVHCKECGELLADFDQLHALYGELEELQAPKGFRERVTQRIDNASPSWFRGALKRHVLQYAFSFVLLCLLVGGMWLWQTREEASLNIEEALLAGEIEIFAEDFLFGGGTFENTEFFLSEDDSVADSILNDLFVGEADTSSVLESFEFTT